MTVFYKLADFFLLITFIILLYFSFFPHPFLPDIFGKMSTFTMILIIIVHIFIKPRKEEKKKESFISHFGISLFIIFLIILFNLIGEESKFDLSFSNPSFWIACVLLFYLDWKNYRKKIKEIESGQV